MKQHKNTLENDALLLIEQNFYFLHLGIFFDRLAKRNDLTPLAEKVLMKTFDDDTTYYFDTILLRHLLEESFDTREEEPTLFEYFVEFNAIRGVAMGMVEALKLPGPFRKFVEKRLSERYAGLVDLLSFVRNVLSHNVHAEIALNRKDFEGTLGRIVRQGRDPNVSLKVDYLRDLPELPVPREGYGFRCHLDFSTLREGTPLLEILSIRELFLLAEFCFNLVVVYMRKRQKRV